MNHAKLRYNTNCLMKQHDLFCLYGSKSIPDISLDKWYKVQHTYAYLAMLVHTNTVISEFVC